MLKRQVLTTGIWTTVLAVLLSLPATAEAKKKATEKKKPAQETKKNDNKKNDNNDKKNQAERAADAALQREISADEATVARDRDALNDCAVKLRSNYESSPEVTAANANLKAAMDAYEAERQILIKTLLTKPGYAQAVADKKAAQKKMDDLRKNDSSSPEDLADAASASLLAGKKVTDMETDALSTDTKAVALKADLNAASEKVSAMKAQFDDSLKRDPGWASAKAKLDADQVTLNSARSRLSK